MADFIALYRGPTVAASRLVAVTAEPELVRRLKVELLGEEPEQDPEEAEHPPALEIVGED